MRAVDTNVVVRLIIRDDPRQVASAESFVTSGAWVSILALTETVWVLSSAYNLGSQEIATAVEKLLSHKHMVFQDRDIVAAALEDFRAKPVLGFSDCLMLQPARNSGHLPLGTFDRRLATLPDTHKL
jgi:predicted nucleic-acid-binding protein